MKTLAERIKDEAKRKKVEQGIVEKDYVQSYVLLGIAAVDELRQNLVFKGGTALKKSYLGDFRFSEDLDFSVRTPASAGALESNLKVATDAAQRAAQVHSPIQFILEKYEERAPHPRGQAAFSIKAQFPWQRQPLVRVLVEITQDEKVLLSPPARPIHHGYEEPFEANVQTYALEEICAEKLRATRQTVAKRAERGWAKPRARDYYDLWCLLRQPAGDINWETVASILDEKCRLRGVAIDTVEDVFDEELLADVRAGWQRTLGPFMTVLPAADGLLAETRERLMAVLRLPQKG